MSGSWVPSPRRFWERFATFGSCVPSARRFCERSAMPVSWVPSSRRFCERSAMPVSWVPSSRRLFDLSAAFLESTRPDSRLADSRSRAVRRFLSSGVSRFRRFAARIFLFLARRLVRSNLDSPGTSGSSSLISGFALGKAATSGHKGTKWPGGPGVWRRRAHFMPDPTASAPSAFAPVQHNTFQSPGSPPSSSMMRCHHWCSSSSACGWHPYLETSASRTIAHRASDGESTTDPGSPRNICAMLWMRQLFPDPSACPTTPPSGKAGAKLGPSREYRLAPVHGGGLGVLDAAPCVMLNPSPPPNTPRLLPTRRASSNLLAEAHAFKRSARAMRRIRMFLQSFLRLLTPRKTDL